MEEIVLLDDANQPIGAAPKLASHHLNTPLHLAFSCYVFNDQGQLLITQRACTKKVWPGVWTNSVCGHPGPGESLEQAIHRRARYELGASVTDFACLLAEYTYKTPPYMGVVEYEFCPVFSAKLQSDIMLNPDEVDAFRWVSAQQLAKLIATEPDVWSYWVKDQLIKLANTNHEFFKAVDVAT